jgi:hypothetical protein
MKANEILFIPASNVGLYYVCGLEKTLVPFETQSGLKNFLKIYLARNEHTVYPLNLDTVAQLSILFFQCNSAVKLVTLTLCVRRRGGGGPWGSDIVLETGCCD